MDEDTYFKMIGDKTASLISASCYLGFLSTSDNEEGAIKMKKFGEYLGIAYQLKDDLSNLIKHKYILGNKMWVIIMD